MQQPPRYNIQLGEAHIARRFKTLAPLSRRLRASLPSLIFPALFVIQALLVMPYPGLHTDEALFGSVLYEPKNLELSVPIGKQQIPLMLINYLGALKAVPYAAWFALWPPSTVSVRVLMILVGALTVWLFFKLLDATLGRRTACVGALLLAADTTFVLTTTFDWGPVALQHLLLLAGLLSLVRFHRSGNQKALGAAFFLFGLALWDKAIFIWILSGMTVAAIVLLRRELSRALTLRRLLIALAAFLAGASPLIVFNLRYGGPTFRNARYSVAGLSDKLYVLRSSLDGSSLFGYLTREPDDYAIARPASRLERLVVNLGDAAGQPRRNLMIPALAASILLLPLIRGSNAFRAALFALVAMLVAWPQMAFNEGTGGSTHHVVLLWPFPHMMMAAAFTEASARLRGVGVWLLAAALAILTAGSLLVTNQHLADLIRYGTGGVWTDAIQPLAERVLRSQPGAVITTDWGMLDSLRLLGRGRLPLYQADDLAAKDSLNAEDQQVMRWLLSLPNPVFVAHTRREEVRPGAAARIAAHAASLGYSKRPLYTVCDRHRRPIFEIFAFGPTSAPDPPLSR